MLALRPRGLEQYFQLVGRGVRIRCKYCPYTPPKECSSYQKWELLAWHAMMGKHLKHPPKFKVIEGKR